MYHARHTVVAKILCFARRGSLGEAKSRQASECFCISINNPYLF
jgi:hypothetical protein